MFDESIDALCQAVTRQYSLIVRRDHRWLNWKFGDQPHVNYRKFVVSEMARPDGCLVVRCGTLPEPRVGIVTDILVRPDDRELLASMATFAVDLLAAEGATAVRAAASTRMYDDVFRSIGFRPFKRLQPMLHTTDNTLEFDSDNMFFGYGEHDLDQYPLARI